MRTNKNQTCSFCNQRRAHAHPMFSGPGTSIRICATCISFAKDLLRHGPSASQHGECSFCERTRDRTEKLLFGPGVNICSECVTFADQRLDGGGSADAKTLSSLLNKVVARIRSAVSGGNIERIVSFER